MCTPTSFPPHQTQASSSATEVPPLVLASQSPSRASILRTSGIGFRTVVSGVDEDAALERAEAHSGRALTPGETALTLARAKAEAVAALPECRGSLVLGCDSVFELDGRAYGKPHEPDVAVRRIREMSGATGTLHTGHWLVDARTELGEPVGSGQTRSAAVTFDDISEAEIHDYVATGEPLEVAGSFTIEGYGAAFIAGIQGESHTVLGLSVNALNHLLRERGLGIAQFWIRNT